MALWPLAVGRDPIFYYLWGFFVPLDYIDIISFVVWCAGTKVYYVLFEVVIVIKVEPIVLNLQFVENGCDKLLNGFIDNFPNG